MTQSLNHAFLSNPKGFAQHRITNPWLRSTA